MISSSAPIASVIIIGNEILSGQTEDANLNYIARRLHDLGIILKEVRMVQDIEGDIVEAVNQCRQKYTYVFTTGGIGPTHDDITAIAMARAFDVPLVCNKDAADRLLDRYPSHVALNARMKMSEMPEGATLINNTLTTAPGFCMDNVFVLAGIPRIMRAMFEAAVPLLKQGPRRHVRIVFAHILEGLIAADLADIQQNYPEIEIGSYPSWVEAGDRGVRIVMKGYALEQVSAVQNKVMQMFRQHGGDPEIIMNEN